MIQELLRILADGNKTLRELSFELKITPEHLKDQIELLMHMGYLEKIENCDINKSDIKKSMPSNECSYCLQSKTCGVPGSSHKTELIGYILTKKGKKFLNK